MLIVGIFQCLKSVHNTYEILVRLCTTLESSVNIKNMYIFLLLKFFGVNKSAWESWQKTELHYARISFCLMYISQKQRIETA